MGYIKDFALQNESLFFRTEDLSMKQLQTESKISNKKPIARYIQVIFSVKEQEHR
jgi:hypothetical protein